MTDTLDTTVADAGSPLLSSGELAAVRADFPPLTRPLRDGRPLVYPDSGAPSQKPRAASRPCRGRCEVAPESR